MSTSQSLTQTASGRRSAESALRKLVAGLAPAQRRILLAVRRSLRGRLATAHEVVYEYRDCVVISFSPSGRGYEGVFAIRASDSGIKLFFNRGKELADPEKRLRGSGTQTRWIAVEDASVLEEPAVARLIDEAIAHNRVPFADAGRGTVVIR